MTESSGESGEGGEGGGGSGKAWRGRRDREELAKGDVFRQRKGGLESREGEEEALTVCDLG